MSNNLFCMVAGATGGGVANIPPQINLTNILTSILEHADTTSSIKVADITIIDDGEGGPNDLSLTGADAAQFEIVGGNELHISSGETFDYAGNPVLTVTVNVNDAGVGGDPDDFQTIEIDVIPTISYQAQGGSFTNNSPSFSSYLTDDLIFAFSVRQADTSAITVPSGWTVIDTEASNNMYGVIAYRRALTDGLDTLGTWSNASWVRYIVARNVDWNDPIGAFSLTTGSNDTSIDHPGLTLEGANSLVVGGSGMRNTASAAGGPGLRDSATSIADRSGTGNKARIIRASTIPTVTWPADADVANDSGIGTQGHIVFACEIKGAE